MNQIIVINGAGGVGKDTFIEILTDIVGKERILNVSTVDKVKEIARSLGWSGAKEPQDRKSLSDLKDMMTYWGDIPFQDVVKRVTSQCEEWEEYGGIDNGYCFIHCREPQEIDRLVNALGAKTMLIRRKLNTEYINHADLEVENYHYDYIIDNNGGLDDLKDKVIKFIKNKAED